MFLLNSHPDHGRPLLPEDAEILGAQAADRVERYLARRPEHAPTPLHDLPGLARAAGVASIRVKDEGRRLGLGSFKALGGAYAVVRLLLDEAGRRLGRTFDVADLDRPEVRAVAATLTFGCATDGNHGRSVAAGAKLVGARAAIFMHEGVSPGRVAAIAAFGAETIRVPGTYDDSVVEASRVCAERGWTVVSDTSWPGYDHVPGLVMEGYTALAREALRAMAPPTHVFLQAGCGGLAAAVAGHLALVLPERPRTIVVEPARAACVFESARLGRPVRVAHGEPTVMAMLECYEPSHRAWRVLARIADAFMTLEEDVGVETMRLVASPAPGDPAIVAGESGCVGLAGFLRAARDEPARTALGIDAKARILVVNSEGATDPERYRTLVGRTPESVAA